MVIGIFLSLALLMWIAYRGYSVIFFAPFLAVLAALTAGFPVFPTYTEIFMPSLANYVKTNFPMFLLGAVFGKVMEESGAAQAIAFWITKKMGTKYAVTAVVLSAAVLTYGGVSLFVVAFAVYPFAAALFKEGNIPKRLIPASIACGSFTFTMTCLPGTPQIQNMIPVKYFTTNAFAAPVTGVVAGIIIAVAGITWLEWRKRRFLANGEDYGTGHNFINEPDPSKQSSSKPLMNPALAIIPLIAVLAFNFAFTKIFVKMDQAAIQAIAPLKATVVASSYSIWSLVAALIIGIALALVFGWKNIKTEANAVKAINAGALGSLLAIMNTASETGYGNVIKSLPGFTKVADFMMSIDPGTPLVSEAITVNVLAGITGSASGGMSIALEAMGAQYLEWANRVGVDPQMLHRVASIASGGMDSLPHNGAVITLLAITGLTHKSSYADIGMVSVVIPFITVFLVIALNALTGLL